LAEDTLDCLRRWRITVAPVTARALIEEVGCLLYEARDLATAWSMAKSRTDQAARPRQVRHALHPPLVRASFGTRMKNLPALPQATSVQTYVDKLARATGDRRISDWYQWLTEAAHPALGARIALGSQPVMHGSGAVTIRCYARRPVPVYAGSSIGLDFTIAHQTADALIVCGTIGVDLLEQTLQLVDDFGLTTRAAELTEYRYWRNLTPVKGQRQCPCGRGSWSACGHRWNAPAPTVIAPQTAALGQPAR